MRRRMFRNSIRRRCIHLPRIMLYYMRFRHRIHNRRMCIHRRCHINHCIPHRRFHHRMLVVLLCSILHHRFPLHRISICRRLSHTAY